VAEVLQQLDMRLKHATTSTSDPIVRAKVTHRFFQPARAISVERGLRMYGFEHSDDLIEPLCLGNNLARVPASSRNSTKPMCLSVLQNAYLGHGGVAIQPSSRTLFELGGGRFVNDWPVYYMPGFALTQRQVESFSKYEGQIVLVISHHHSTTYHHVVHELIPRYLLLVPLLDAVPEILVATDGGPISSKLLPMLGLATDRIIQFPEYGRLAHWRFASVLLFPMPLYDHQHMGYYPPEMEHDVAAVLRDLVSSQHESERNVDGSRSSGKPVMVVLERAKRRRFSGACYEERCVKNFKRVYKALDKAFSQHFDIKLYKANDDISVAIPLFASASVVVGVHGAGFQNTMFCHENTTVVHIGWRSHYQDLADEFNLKYHLVLVPDLARETRNYVVKDVDGLVRSISLAIERDFPSTRVE